MSFLASASDLSLLYPHGNCSIATTYKLLTLPKNSSGGYDFMGNS